MSIVELDGILKQDLRYPVGAIYYLKTGIGNEVDHVLDDLSLLTMIVELLESQVVLRYGVVTIDNRLSLMYLLVNLVVNNLMYLLVVIRVKSHVLLVM